VDGHYQQEAAADDIRNLRGVVRLVNRIGIKPRPNATDIRDNIKGTLDRLWLGPETISVTAREGKVTLTGTVETWYSRELADSTAWAAPGVTAVENDIKVN
jgi:osmotically-inducible protein OsmY